MTIICLLPQARIPQKRWSGRIIVNKTVQNAVLVCNLKNGRMTSVCFQGKPFKITVIQVYVPTSDAEETEAEWFYEDLQDLLEQTPKKMSFSLQGTGMQKQELKKYLEYLALEYRMKQGKGQQSFAKRTHWSQQTPCSNNTREDSIRGHHQMVNTKIRLIILFVAKDGEALYSQQKQDQELTVAQTMNSLLPNSDLN